MTNFNVRADSLDVTKLMEEIQSRLQKKRGVDYTEEEIRELASVTLARFLDPTRIRSDLVEHYRRVDAESSDGDLPSPEYYDFTEAILYSSLPTLRGRFTSFCRRVARPLAKLLLNTRLTNDALEKQAAINHHHAQLLNRQWRASDRALLYELFHNLVVETTRLAIETQNHKMRIDALEGRLDFDERRAKALEEVVEYRSGATMPQPNDRPD